MAAFSRAGHVSSFVAIGSLEPACPTRGESSICEYIWAAQSSSLCPYRKAVCLEGLNHCLLRHFPGSALPVGILVPNCRAGPDVRHFPSGARWPPTRLGTRCRCRPGVGSQQLVPVPGAPDMWISQPMGPEGPEPPNSRTPTPDTWSGRRYGSSQALSSLWPPLLADSRSRRTSPKRA